MALREYSAFNKSAGASILAYGCNLTNMDGTLLTGTAPLYFQIHDKASAPASNDVPIKSYEITQSGPFPLASVFQTMGTIPLANGLAVGISSTANTYTAATATYSVFGEVEEGTQQTDSLSSLSTGGDTTTPVDSLTVWSDGDNNNADRLVRFTASNLAAGIRYLMLFPAKANSQHPIDNDVPIAVWKFAIGQTRDIFFGPNGISPVMTFKADTGLVGPYTPQYGCFLISSSTGNKLTATSDTSFTIKAYFRTT